MSLSSFGYFGCFGYVIGVVIVTSWLSVLKWTRHQIWSRDVTRIRSPESGHQNRVMWCHCLDDRIHVAAAITGCHCYYGYHQITWSEMLHGRHGRQQRQHLVRLCFLATFWRLFSDWFWRLCWQCFDDCFDNHGIFVGRLFFFNSGSVLATATVFRLFLLGDGFWLLIGSFWWLLRCLDNSGNVLAMSWGAVLTVFRWLSLDGCLVDRLVDCFVDCSVDCSVDFSSDSLLTSSSDSLSVDWFWLLWTNCFWLFLLDSLVDWLVDSFKRAVFDCCSEEAVLANYSDQLSWNV